VKRGRERKRREGERTRRTEGERGLASKLDPYIENIIYGPGFTLEPKLEF